MKTNNLNINLNLNTANVLTLCVMNILTEVRSMFKLSES